MLKTLFKYIKDCYGYSSNNKTPIVIRNDENEIISFKSTHDGKEILKAFSSKYKDSYYLNSILETVNSFETEYGDGTSLLILLILNMMSNLSVISEEDLNEVLKLLSLNSKFISSDKSKKGDKFYRDNWIKTVCRNEVFSKKIIDIFEKSNRIANIYENSSTLLNNNKYSDSTSDLDENKEFDISIVNRDGFTINTHVNSRYTIPKYKLSNNCKIFIHLNKLNMADFNIMSTSSNNRIFIFCYDYDEEVENLITSSEDINTIVIRVPINNRYILEDLSVVVNVKKYENDTILYSTCKNIIIDSKSVTLSGFDNNKDDIGKYCESIINAPNVTSLDQKLIKNRVDNIISNNVSDIIITSKSASIRTDVKFMIEDLKKSEHLKKYGYVSGALDWVSEEKHFKGNILIQYLLQIKYILNRNPNSKNKLKHPFDLFKCIQKAIITAVRFHNSEINTTECIDVNFKHYY